MASVADIQWANFSSNIVHEWSGLWTFWNADTRQVINKFRSVRSFVALDEGITKIKHQNSFQSEDTGEALVRPELEGPWEILKQDADEHGVCHPHLKDSRAVLHSNGGGIWTKRHVSTDRFFMELYLQSRDGFRCSVIVVYNESKELRSFGFIREKKLNTPAEMWSSSTELQSALPLSRQDKEFVGVEKTFDKNLQLHVVPGCKWDKGFWLNDSKDDHHTVLFLPDNMCLSCPSKLSSDSFSLRACVLFPLGEEPELQELTVTFADGCLHSVKQGLYY